jgi:hypothetical protein
MSSRQYRPLLCGALCAAVALIITACVENSPTVPTVESIELAKGGVKNPTVKNAVPDSAQQSETLDVHVYGSGFDDGSRVQFNRGGGGGVATNSTSFVSQRELVANIDVAIDADTGLYNIEVTTSRDKKGIGTEMFRVRKKVNNGPIEWPEAVSMEVDVLPPGETHGMTDVVAVDDSIARNRAHQTYLCNPGDPLPECNAQEKLTFFGCPDATRSCNRLRFTFTGDADWIGIAVEPSAQGCLDGTQEIEGGCVYDPDLQDSWMAATFYMTYQPSMLLADLAGTPALVENPDGSRTLRVYWQGQRGGSDYVTGDYIWSRYPDLDFPGTTDYFLFRAQVAIGAEVKWLGIAYSSCDATSPCWAEYKGAAGSQAYAYWDAFALGGGKGRNKDRDPKYLAFDLQLFSVDPNSLPQAGGGPDYLDSDVTEANLKAWPTLMVMDPSGIKSILSLSSVGMDPNDPDKPSIYKSAFRLPFVGAGCYEVKLMDAFVHDFSALEYVWYSQGDPDALYLRVDYLPDGTVSWQKAQRCSGAP